MAKLKEHIAQMLGDIQHWKTDVQCGVKPRLEHLNDAEMRILGLMGDYDFEAGLVDYDLRKAIRNARALQMTRAQILEIVNAEMVQ